ncbi:MAG: undecaprenyl-phosphate glucose phosphotransferase, partial [Cellvibrionaceae bacterium]|nr:undecaprenyl-phosphate glucose phosphotransferase [Cellvibrionaceae bacterium]
RHVPIIGKLSAKYLRRAPFNEYEAACEYPAGAQQSESQQQLQLVANKENEANNQNESQSGQALDSYTLVNDTETLVKLVKSTGIKRVYIALPMLLSQQVSKLNVELMDHNVDVIWAPDIYALNLVNHSVREVSGVPIISLNESPLTSSRLSTVVKDVMDRTLAALALLTLAPVMLIIAGLVKLSSKGPVIFKQQRHGWDGSIIEVWKFRSMRLHDESDGEVKQATKDDDRITPIGKFIRRTSLDELPQFINVLQGRMSLVGPRPHAVSHNHFYSQKINSYLARHRIKPGITGLAQISGCRGETETIDKMQERVEYDLAYINNWSLWLDLKILIKTPFTLFAKDIY